MAIGEAKAFLMNMAATAGSATVDLTRAFDRVYLQVPTMPSSTAMDLYGSVDGSTYYQIRRDQVLTSTIQSYTFTIAASYAANGAIVPISPGFRYYKVIATDSAPTSTIGFYVVCGSG